MKDTHPGLKKLDDRSKSTIFVGYKLGSNTTRETPLLQRIGGNA